MPSGGLWEPGGFSSFPQVPGPEELVRPLSLLPGLLGLHDPLPEEQGLPSVPGPVEVGRASPCPAQPSPGLQDAAYEGILAHPSLWIM